MNLRAGHIVTRIASTLVVLAVVLPACRHRDTVGEAMQYNQPRNEMPALSTADVSTLISDSGVTRYRIEAPLWEFYDRAEPPYQEFREGIYLEQFDEQLEVQASLKADYGHYNETDQVWFLRGNVHALNRKGEQFDSPRMFWSQKTHRVYSDTIIKITRETSIIEGVGFDSNEEMSKYTILQPTGVFPIDEE